MLDKTPTKLPRPLIPEWAGSSLNYRGGWGGMQLQEYKGASESFKVKSSIHTIRRDLIVKSHLII